MSKNARSGSAGLAVESKVFALLGYLAILCVLPLLFCKEDSFVFSHAKQGLVLFVAEVAVFILSIILPQILIKLLLFIVCVFSFIGIVKVLRGETANLPVISHIADKIFV